MSAPARTRSRAGKVDVEGSQAPIVKRIALRSRDYVGFAPAVLLFGGFFLVPMGLIACYSFWQVAENQVVRRWTLDNYSYLLGTPTYLRTLAASIWMAALATLVILALALPLCFWLVRYVPRRWRRVFVLAMIAPFWTSYLLRVTAWTSILGDRGLVNRLLMDLNMIAEPLPVLLYNRSAVVVVLVYLYFPFGALAVYAAVGSLDWVQLSAAADLGASSIRRFIHVVLPQLRAGMTTAAVICFVPMLGEYLAPQLVGGTQGVMIGNLVANFFQTGQYTRGAAIALVIAALVTATLVLLRRSLDVGRING